MEALTFKPEEWGMKRGTENEDFMFQPRPEPPLRSRCVPVFCS